MFSMMREVLENVGQLESCFSPIVCVFWGRKNLVLSRSQEDTDRMKDCIDFLELTF